MLLITSSTTAIICGRHLFTKLEVLGNWRVYIRSVVSHPSCLSASPPDCSAISLFFKMHLSLFSGSFLQALLGKSVPLTPCSTAFYLFIPNYLSQASSTPSPTLRFRHCPIQPRTARGMESQPFPSWLGSRKALAFVSFK